MPWLPAMTARGAKATAYVCQNFACQEPTGDPMRLEAQLKNAAEPNRIL